MKYEPSSPTEWIWAGMLVILAGMLVILAGMLVILAGMQVILAGMLVILAGMLVILAGMQVILAGMHAGQWGVKLRPPASLEDRCSQAERNDSFILLSA